MSLWPDSPLALEAAIYFEKSTRCATNFQNRILKGYSGMSALDQHEAMMGQQRSSPIQSLVDNAEGDQVFALPK